MKRSNVANLNVNREQQVKSIRILNSYIREEAINRGVVGEHVFHVYLALQCHLLEECFL